MVFAGEHHVVLYRSDISGNVLEFGKWFHRLGTDKDISDKVKKNMI